MADFFNKTHCDRCNKTLTVRIMSWFTNDCICMECKEIESVIKQTLREQGIKNAKEGCGYIPAI